METAPTMTLTYGSPCDVLKSMTSINVTSESTLQQFSTWYQSIHGYLSVFVCLFGIISNTMNIIVLTQKEMITSTNVILSSLAVADMLTMMSYLPYAIYFYCISRLDPLYGHSRGWVIYLIFNLNFVVTTRTVAMWLTVLLAVFRYIVVSFPLSGPNLCSIKNAKIMIVAVVILSIVFIIPNYVQSTVVNHGGVEGCLWSGYRSFVTSDYSLFNYWLYAVVLKMAPCVLLTVLSALLVRAMRQADSKRRKLKKSKTLVGSTRTKEHDERAAEHQRTTAMLVAVVLTFVAVELPHGIVAFLSGIDSWIFDTVYIPLGDVWDQLVLVNSSVNFVLYCIMSRQFRKTFSALFLRCLPSSTNSATNGASYTTVGISEPTRFTATTKV